MNNKYLNRELSWLEFNGRVLAEAMDVSNPILERLKFIGIVSSNLDEFFMVRVASLKDTDPDILLIKDRARQLMKDRDHYFINAMVTELESSGIKRIIPETLQKKQTDYVKRLFKRELLPVLTPISLSEDRPLPSFANLKLYMIVGLLDTSDRSQKKYAAIEIPRNFPRMISLPSQKDYQFMLIEELLSMFIRELFAGYELVDLAYVRFTRAAEMSLDEEKDEDFREVMSEAIRSRRHAEIVRLEASISTDIMKFLKSKIHISDNDFYEIHSWLDLKSVSLLAFQSGFEDLKRPQWEPRTAHNFERDENIWKLLKEKDVWLHHPYESFDAVNRFISKAADDPAVLAIKQTLYRAGEESSIIHSLERAAGKGKQVTVLVELKARFDEESNIEWAKRLEKAGASVLYGVAGVKTHAKVCLVVRREHSGIRRYVHLSTGNYNEKTARLYSDIGLFTNNEDFANDITSFFNMITGYSLPVEWSKIEVSPSGLRKRLSKLIKREAMRSTKDNPGLIIAKMNSLSDHDIIDSLYDASNSGVKIKLNIRGICCLKPGIEGLSGNIEVVSIVDMFLEHTRIFYFYNGGDDELYLSSADWMPRNLDRRIEIIFPVEDEKIKKELLDLLNLYFKDNTKSCQLLPDGSYKRLGRDSGSKFRIQEYLCEKVIDEEKKPLKSIPRELKPQIPFSRS